VAQSSTGYEEEVAVEDCAAVLLFGRVAV